jgi:hypothetical protein
MQVGLKRLVFHVGTICELKQCRRVGNGTSVYNGRGTVPDHQTGNKAAAAPKKCSPARTHKQPPFRQLIKNRTATPQNQPHNSIESERFNLRIMKVFDRLLDGPGDGLKCGMRNVRKLKKFKT